jgi:hypothetical protein
MLAAILVLAAPPAVAERDCNVTSTGFVPLSDLGAGTYEGETGGLYPDGSNELPADHLRLGLERAKQVLPRGKDGSPDPDGDVVMISIGVSNTMIQFNAFRDLVAGSPEVADNLVLVNGAQVGRALGQWSLRSNDSTWRTLDQTLDAAGVTPEQVQVAWIMLPSKTRGPLTFDDAHSDIQRLVVTLQTAKQRYPNLELAYFSSRMYGGYIGEENSEPNAYNHGFETKWLIEEQLNGSVDLNADPDRGTVVAPWIAWGPYLWADGMTPRRDGLVWRCDDFADDGVHPGRGAGQKVAALLLEHFKKDPTARTWFLDPSGEFAAAPTATAARDGRPASSHEIPTTTPDSTRRDGRSQEPSDDRGRTTLANPSHAASADRTRRTLVGVGLAGLVFGAAAAGAIRRHQSYTDDNLHLDS